MVDFLRSCYSTTMQIVAGGRAVPVDWYFVPGNPLLGVRTVYGSLNWSRPHYGIGNAGEVIGAPRTWRDGSRPVYVPANPTHSRSGTVDNYAGIDNADLSTPRPLTFRGQSNFPPGAAAGLFPPWRFQVATPPLSSSIYGVATLTGPASYEWEWNGRFPIIDIFWGIEAGPKWSCFPGTAALFGVRNTGPPPVRHFLRCTAYNSVNGVSTWDDPDGGVLDPGEVLTLNGF